MSKGVVKNIAILAVRGDIQKRSWYLLLTLSSRVSIIEQMPVLGEGDSRAIDFLEVSFEVQLLSKHS